MSKDHLTDYFAEIRKIRVLSKDEEVALMGQIRAGQANSNDPVAVANGNAARIKMVRHNLRLVVVVAKRMRRRSGTLDFEDLIFAGNEGLLKGIDEKVDLSRGRFSTGAYYWIRQAVMHAIYWHSRSIRVPTHAWRTRAKLGKAIVQLTSDLKRSPTVEELVDYTGISQTKQTSNSDAFHKIISFEEELDEEGEGYATLYQEQNLIEPDELTAEQLSIRQSLNSLRFTDELTFSVLNLQFGLGGKTLSFSEIAEELNLPVAKIKLLSKKGLITLQSLESDSVHEKESKKWITAA